MVSQPTFPGCIIESWPIGVFEMFDGDLCDDKILAVPASDPLFNEYRNVSNISPHYLREAAHFFQVYMDLGGNTSEAVGLAAGGHSERTYPVRCTIVPGAIQINTLKSGPVSGLQFLFLNF